MVFINLFGVAELRFAPLSCPRPSPLRFVGLLRQLASGLQSLLQQSSFKEVGVFASYPTHRFCDDLSFLMLHCDGVYSYSTPLIPPSRGDGDCCPHLGSRMVAHCGRFAPTSFACDRSVFVVSECEFIDWVGVCRLPNIFLGNFCEVSVW